METPARAEGLKLAFVLPRPWEEVCGQGLVVGPREEGTGDT